MSDFDDDKKTPEQPAKRPTDKTVFSPAKKPEPGHDSTPGQDPASRYDATTVQPPRGPKVPPAQTRVARPSRHSKTASADKTRLSDKTRIAPPADATRFAPRGRQRPAPDGGAATQVAPSPRAATKASDAERASAQSPYGLLKGRFMLQDVLGSGGMGVVYKAKDRLKIEAQDKDPYVAIKVLSDEFKSHPEAFIALQRESRKTQRIAHPNIVNVHDFDRDGTTVFMTMEFLDGKPLDKLLTQYRGIGLPEEDCERVLEGICSALIYAHAENIIHADLKPGNIFVTNRGVPKVFDFGIARAVAKAERSDDAEDKTVFDAGNLGALTPAYASLEMLEGASPDPRDDLYALGCIAYEIFSGQHPFNRVHADEAKRQKLKPKRISGLKKQQWRAIEACLAFEREQRMGSVQEFWRTFAEHKVAKLKYVVGAVVIMASMAAAAYQYRDEYLPQFSEQEVRSEIEQQLRVELKRENLVQLIRDASFTTAWEADVWREYQDLAEILGSTDIWLATQNAEIYQLYLDRISELVSDGELARAQDLLANAYRYTDEPEQLEQLEQQLLAALERREREQAEQQEAQRAAEALAARQTERREQQATVNREFDRALGNVDQQLACRQQLNMEDLRIAVEKLRELDSQRYQREESRIVNDLVACIEFVGESFADRAQTFKQEAMALFPRSSRVAGIAISPRDPCDPSLAGTGARGPRASCRDQLPGVGNGPTLVVIPGVDGGGPYAIGKEEVSVADYNRFCQATGCEPVEARRGDWPVTNIRIEQAQRYLDWLSEESGYRYRLPTEREWHHAADANGSAHDSNRNCQFESRGIQRGNNLARVGVGRQNQWGLVNHIGNAREWVTRSGGALVAAGGSYRTRMDDCRLDTRQAHRGQADPETGVRVLRELDQ